MKPGFLQQLAIRVRPAITRMTAAERAGQFLNMYSVFCYTPLMLVGLFWLASETRFALLSDQLGVMVGLLVFAFILQRYSFDVQIELRPGVMASGNGNFVFVISLSALFIFGPSALWLELLPSLGIALFRFVREKNHNVRWGQMAAMTSSTTTSTLPYLMGFWIYQRIGGQLPFASFSFSSLMPAVILLLFSALVPYLIMFPMINYVAHAPEMVGGNQASLKNLYLFIFIQSIVQYLALPFTLLGAYLYTVNGAAILFFFLLAILFSSLLANQLTQNVKQRTQRARELAALEELGRKIIAAPPDLSTLSEILTTHMPLMFLATRGMIWLEPDRILYQTPNVTFPAFDGLQNLVSQGDNPPYQYLKPGTLDDDPLREGLVIPIRDDENSLLGGVLLATRRDQTKITEYIPALQSLAAQIASAIYRAETHKEALLKERMANELELAGRIQANFLPEKIPTLPGYEIAASLTPALQTSGDFYDFIPYPDGRLGFVVADVADKGTGAALFMALTRTLLRTYVLEYPDDPALAFKLTNDRVHEDTQSQLFITTFYGIIDPQQHTLTYVNGGHNPPFLFTPSDSNKPQSLIRTGVPIGMLDEVTWKSAQVPFPPDHFLVLYTDGVTEAQNAAQEFFDEDRLIEASVTHKHSVAKDIHTGILQTIHTFVADAPQFDDITLMVIRRTS
ncbi:MAG: SpoIIE family protein phosphatase [Anaerolineales bacterium]|nr:SpoIIE family protein phosphatase [Anaerolineales bacterium]